MGTGASFRRASSGGGGGITTSQLNARLGAYATQSALQSLQDASLTEQEVASVRNVIGTKTIRSAVRQTDQSILVTFTDDTTETIAASTAVDSVQAVTAAQYTALTDAQKTGKVIAWVDA